jgi:hypothetical protein
MRRGLATLMIALAAALVAVPLGIAATSGGTDERGDVEGSPSGGAPRADIVSATAGRVSNGQIKHTVTVAGAAADPASGDLATYIYIEAQTDAGAMDDCTFFVGRYHGRPGVYLCGTGERRGSARIVRTSEHTTRYTFSPRALGNPKTYQWAVITRDVTNRPGAMTRHDRLPSGDEFFFEQKLR